MLDLETMGTAPGSAILAIGAVEFAHSTILGTFYQKIDLQSAVDLGLVMDPQTVLWWLRQSDASRLEIAQGEGGHIKDVLSDFSNWLRENAIDEEIEMWGNGAAFDNTLLAAAYHKLGMRLPWKYSNDRCYRTVKNLYPDVQMVRDGTHHNALDDARSQAMHLMAMIPSL